MNEEVSTGVQYHCLPANLEMDTSTSADHTSFPESLVITQEHQIGCQRLGDGMWSVGEHDGDGVTTGITLVTIHLALIWRTT